MLIVRNCFSKYIEFEVLFVCREGFFFERLITNLYYVSFVYTIAIRFVCLVELVLISNFVVIITHDIIDIGVTIATNR